MTPLEPGDLALRFLIDWPALPGLQMPGSRPRVLGVQVVEIVATAGESVAWTNYLPNRRGDSFKFVHRCARREVIALSALESLGLVCATKTEAAAEETAAVEQF